MTTRTEKTYTLYYERKQLEETWGVLIFKMWANETNEFCISEKPDFYTDNRLSDYINYPNRLIEQNNLQYIESLQCSKWADKYYKILNQESSKLKRLRKYHNEVCGKYLEWFGQNGLAEPKTPPFFYLDNNFETVQKNMNRYTLTTNQSAVIRVMYQAYIEGDIYLSFNDIINRIELIIEATRMSAVFDNNEEAKNALISYDNRLQKYFLKD